MNISLGRYKKTFKADLMGGLLAAIIGLPMGLAFGVQSGLGPQAGIYTAVILAFVAGIFGGTRTLISDPTGPMTVVAATVVAMSLSNAGDLATAWPLIVGTFVLAGVFEMIFGFLDFGKYVKFMPYPVLSGFMAGIGVIIISVQLFPLMGHSSPKGFVHILMGLSDPITHINWAALGLGALTIGIVYGLPKITKRIPSILIALITGTAISMGFGLDVPVIGHIPREFPVFHLTEMGSLHWTDFSIILTPAIMLGGLGVIDSLLTSVVADNLTKTKHNSKWTAVGQGVGNIVAALFGGIPGAGATMGTVTNIKAGATTKLSGMMKGVFLLAIVVGVADYVQFIPMSVLAAILITIGIGIIDYKGIKMLFKVPKQDAIVWIIVLLVTLFDNLLDAVGIGFALSSVLFIGRMSKQMTAAQTSNTLDNVLEEHPLPADLADKIFVKRLDGPLFFGYADRFRNYCESIDHVLAVIVEMDRVPFLDQSGLVTLESVIHEWHDRGIQVYIVGANFSVLDSLKKVKVVPDLVIDEHVFDGFNQCLMAIRNLIDEKGGSQNYEELILDHSLQGKRVKWSESLMEVNDHA